MLSRGSPFASWASGYDDSALQSLLYEPVHNAVVEQLRRHAPTARRLLDVGCGTGRLLETTGQRYPIVVGLDPWGTSALPCAAPVSGPFDPTWLLTGRCLRGDLAGATVAVDVPGFTMDQIDVQFVDNVLTLSAERPEEVKEQSGNGKKGEDARWHIVERSRGSFSRSIKFPVPIDGANVKAQLKGGVLTVTVPKGVEARAQKIKITES